MVDETVLPPDEAAAETQQADGDTAPEQVASVEAGPAEPADEDAVSEESGVDEGDTAESEAAAQPTHRRRETRDFEVSGDVTIDGKAFPLKDWSSSGFGIVSCDLEFEDHARVDIGFNVTHSNGSLLFSCKAIIVRADPESCEVAGAFVEMAREDRVAVAAYFDALDEA